jgi:replicative DNA helicase
MEHMLKWFTNKGDGRAAIYVQWFAITFRPENFSGLDALYACFIIYCAKLSVVPCSKYLESYLRVDGMADVKEYKIRLDDMDSYDYDQLSQLMEAYDVIKEVAMSTFDVYMNEDIEDMDFKVAAHEFMSTIKQEKITNLIMQTIPHLSDGSDVDKLSENLRYSLVDIKDTYDVDKISEVDYAEEHKDQKMELICTTGIDAIDTDYGGIYTHIMYTLNSQPSGGKTRFGLAHFAYRIMTIAKKDVLCYETELTKAQTKNILISYHIAKLYGVKVPDKLINQDRLTEHQRHLVESAKIDLFESGKYGHFEIKDECIVETLDEELKFAVKTNPNLRLIMIDYMGLVDSKPLTKYGKRLEGYEIITEAYKIVRRILRIADVSALCINQFNDKGIDAAFAGKTIKPGFIQGGHIVHRHTDYDLSMTYTEEQNLGGEDKIKFRTLSNTKTRGSSGFGSTLLSADLGVSLFKQEVRQ